MEVILKEDVNKLGHRGDVVKVADGYGRNYLLPGKLAMEATIANKAVIEQMKTAATSSRLPTATVATTCCRSGWRLKPPCPTRPSSCR